MFSLLMVDCFKFGNQKKDYSLSLKDLTNIMNSYLPVYRLELNLDSTNSDEEKRSIANRLLKQTIPLYKRSIRAFIPGVKNLPIDVCDLEKKCEETLKIDFPF